VFQTPSRRGYTLLEVILTMIIAVLLLGALYGALQLQLRHAQAGRDTVEHSTLARVLFNRIDIDVGGGINLADPSRFRLQANNQSAGGSASGSGSTNSNTTNNSTTGGSGGSGSGSSAATNSIILPMGVQGDSERLTLYLSKVPREIYGRKPTDAGQVTSDLRRVTYWLAAGKGLAHQEVLVITSQDADPSNLPMGSDEEKAVFAPEVRNVHFSYFDGTNWQDSWDATTLGSDGVTPIGPPRAIAIDIDIARTWTLRRDEEKLVHYRHVVAIPSANGATQQPQQGGGTSP
jgi:prepilin-type N-terminal cleavage/methylation domain-containing protein